MGVCPRRLRQHGTLIEVALVVKYPPKNNVPCVSGSGPVSGSAAGLSAGLHPIAGHPSGRLSFRRKGLRARSMEKPWRLRGADPTGNWHSARREIVDRVGRARRSDTLPPLRLSRRALAHVYFATRFPPSWCARARRKIRRSDSAVGACLAQSTVWGQGCRVVRLHSNETQPTTCPQGAARCLIRGTLLGARSTQSFDVVAGLLTEPHQAVV